jgi:Protein of unknown function (DUF2924)
VCAWIVPKGSSTAFSIRPLRTLWRTMLRSSPAPALTKELIARFICWHIQEQALGGLDPDTAKLLADLARGNTPGGNGPRRLKPGTVLVREYQGERHTVTVVPGGFVWREATYPEQGWQRRRGGCQFEPNRKSRRAKAGDVLVKDTSTDWPTSLGQTVA